MKKFHEEWNYLKCENQTKKPKEKEYNDRMIEMVAAWIKNGVDYEHNKNGSI